jgi:hypothetical protein
VSITMRTGALGALLITALLITVSLAQAQDPRTIIMTADQSLQQGNMNVFGLQLQQVISQQTGGTGRYQALVQLGPITNVAVGGAQQVQNGVIVQGRAFHQVGYADWTLGFSYLTQKIEFGNFNPVVANWPGGPPGAPSGPPATPTTGGPSTTPAVPSTKEDACAKYPTLC